jgi:hypothetical protein
MKESNYVRQFYTVHDDPNLFTLSCETLCKTHRMTTELWGISQKARAGGRSFSVATNLTTGAMHFTSIYNQADMVRFKLFLAGVPIQKSTDKQLCLMLSVKSNADYIADLLIPMHLNNIDPATTKQAKREADERYAKLANTLADIKGTSAKACKARAELFKCPAEQKAYMLGHVVFVVYTLVNDYGMTPAELSVPSEVYF